MLTLLLLFACAPDGLPADTTPAADSAPAVDTASPCAVEAELCDGRDNDCDGVADEGFDADGDGVYQAACAPLGWEVDCDDLDPDVYPGAPETCDGVDNDCSGVIDDLADADGDGFTICDDCDDADGFVYPGAPEACDGVDNDCSGFADEEWDQDGDGASPCDGDCDDADPWNAGHLEEVCDGVDNDCDGALDEGFDADGDGVSTCRGDCDDADPSVFPGNEEICDDVDNDCDPATTDREDSDGDGLSLCDGDCDDSDAAVYPDASEVCDGVDNNCDGAVDEHPECFDCTIDAPYMLCALEVPWADADAACRDLGGQLAVIDDADENALLAGLGAAHLGVAFWLGLSDLEDEGVWLWSDGSALGYASWGSGEPNDYGSGEDCVHTNYNGAGVWNDLTCGEIEPFACEAL